MDWLEVVRLVLRFGHIVGVALLLGGFAVQALARQHRINSAMVYGVLTQLVTGIALSAPLRGEGREPEPAKLVVKLVLALLLAAMVIVVRKKESVAAGHFWAIGGVTLLEIGVAVFWI